MTTTNWIAAAAVFFLSAAGMPAQGVYKTILASGFGDLTTGTPLGALTEVRPGLFAGAASDIFEVNRSGEFRITSPEGNTDFPRGTLFPASDGYLYGSQIDGYLAGPVYAIFATDLTGPIKPLQSVSGTGGVIEAANGLLYGIYATGLSYPQNPPDQFFQMTLGGSLTPLGDALFPPTELPGGLIQANDGNFYGIQVSSQDAGDSYTQVYQLTPSGAYTLLLTFDAAAGQEPNPQLVERGNVLFGSAVCGGSNVSLTMSCTEGYGVVFSVDLHGNVKSLHVFQDGSDGAYPSALVLGGDGNLYGQSLLSSGHWQLFRVSPDGQSFAIVAKYPKGAGAGTLIQGSDGKFYGLSLTSGIFSVDVGLPPPPPTVKYFRPTSGAPGAKVLIRGEQLLGFTGVSFNGVPATEISSKGVLYTYATIPPGATSGPITITTTNGSSTSTQTFTVE